MTIVRMKAEQFCKSELVSASLFFNGQSRRQRLGASPNRPVSEFANGNHAPAGREAAVTSDRGLALLNRIAGYH
jgi:hypothetical protein